MYRLKKYILLFGVAITYMVASLCINEFHPFSRFPMYNQFPNWSYAFYLTDQDNNIIPAQKLNMTGGGIGHLYYSIAQHKNIKIGNGVEDKKDLAVIGNAMLNEILKRNTQQIEFKKLNLYRKYFYFSGDSIINTETLMYEKGF